MSVVGSKKKNSQKHLETTGTPTLYFSKLAINGKTQAFIQTCYTKRNKVGKKLMQEHYNKSNI